MFLLEPLVDALLDVIATFFQALIPDGKTKRRKKKNARSK